MSSNSTSFMFGLEVSIFSVVSLFSTVESLPRIMSVGLFTFSQYSHRSMSGILYQNLGFLTIAGSYVKRCLPSSFCSMLYFVMWSKWSFLLMPKVESLMRSAASAFSWVAKDEVLLTYFKMRLRLFAGMKGPISLRISLFMRDGSTPAVIMPIMPPMEVPRKSTFLRSRCLNMASISVT